MTKEELKKEATEYAQKLGAKDFIAKPKEIVAYFGYLAGAEPREKRNADLELKIKHLTRHLEPQAMSALLEQVEEEVKQEQRVNELETQIEKMKCWSNCKNYQECLIELAEQGKGMNPAECCVNCKKWELRR